MKPVTPVFYADLLPKIDQKLLEILQEISPEDWHKPTIVPQWRIKDIAAHLLDGNLRTLSMLQDNYYGESPGEVSSQEQMVAYLNGLNADWVKAMRRLSPSVMITLLASSGAQYCAYLQSLDSFAISPFSVGWAGEQESKNWFHIAREYTEKWHHQQQIRLAVGQEAPLYTKEFYYPYLETSMRGLPHHYRSIQPTTNTLIRITVTGAGGGDWFLYFDEQSWQLVTEPGIQPACEVIIPEDIAWRVFTKGINRELAKEKSEVRGEEQLGNHVFEMIAIMG